VSIFKQSLSQNLQISMLDLDMAFDANSFVDGFPPGKASGNVSERAIMSNIWTNAFAGWYGSISV
jgi:hypothetical protein